MLWFTVWAVLVVGTLIGAFLVLRSLYRKAKALLEELTRAAETTGALADRAEELAERLEQARAEQLARERAEREADPWRTAAAHARRAELSMQRDARRAARQARHEETYRRWRALIGL